MKKVLFMQALLFCAVLLSLSFCSCSDKDDDKDPILGKWTYVSTEIVTVQTNSEANNEKTKIDVQKESAYEYSGFWYHFGENAYVSSGYDDEEDDELSEGSFTLSDNIVRITLDATKVFSGSLTDGKLVFERDITDEYSNLELDQLLAMGITDHDYKADKVVVKVIFHRM